MSDFIVGILSNAPLWVWALLLVLLFIGLMATRTRNSSIIPYSDVEQSRSRLIIRIWLIAGAVLSLIVGFLIFVMSGFCICDFPPKPDPLAALLSAGGTFIVWSALCGLAFLLRRWALTIWVIVLVALGAIGFVVYIFTWWF